MRSILERTGIYGWDWKYERALLASLVTGTPVLMIGEIGEAKTTVAEKIAAVLGQRFQKIAADKVNFEDMVGFPNPESLSKGEVSYSPTPISIWTKHFLLIDEISRCNPQMQNKFLEIVLDRQVMGIPTEVKWVWATMNPLTYPGSQPLDGALAGRMGYIFEVPRTIKNKDESVIHKIISSRNFSQTPALEHWLGESRSYKWHPEANLTTELTDLLQRSAIIIAGLDDVWTPVISKYLTAFGRSLANSGLPLDGRRLVMIRYNILANIAVQTASFKRALETDEIIQLCKDVLPISLPILATSTKDTFDTTKIFAAHQLASDFLRSADSLLYRLVSEQNQIEKVKLLFVNKQKIDSLAMTNLVATIYEKMSDIGTEEEQLQDAADNFAIKLALTTLALKSKDIPVEALAIIGKNYPINYSEETYKSGITLTDPQELDSLLKLNQEIIASGDKNKAAWYFAIEYNTQQKNNKPVSISIPFEKFIRSYEVCLQSLENVVTALQEFLPKDEHVLDSSNSNQASISANSQQENQTQQLSHSNGATTSGPQNESYRGLVAIGLKSSSDTP